MTHFGIAQWVDFARALAPEAEQAAMREHLADGCAECRQIVDFCHKVAAVCGGMQGYEAPESAVGLARAIFPTQAPPRPTQMVRA